MEKSNFKIITSRNALTLFLSCIFIFSTIATFGQAKKTDYTGKWTLNESKSQLGEGMGRRAATKIAITQTDSVINVEKTSTRQSGETVTALEKYKLDGSESDNSANNRKKKSTTSWSTDLKELTIKSTSIFERDGNTMEIKSIEVYKLSSDDISLVIETTSTSDRGEFKASLFYDRAE